MQNLRLATLGAACAVAMTAAFVVGIALMAGSGVQVLIPETGSDNLTWLTDAESAGDTFAAGAWIVVLGGVFGLVALLGFYEVLRGAGPAMILGPVLGITGFTLVTISHILPIAIARQLAPAYFDADEAARTSIAAASNTLAQLSLGINLAGDLMLWGVVVPLYGLAILRTAAAPRWIGWTGIGVGFFAGALSVLAPFSSVIEGVSTIGFFGFFLFMTSFGISILRRTSRPETPATAPLPTAGA